MKENELTDYERLLHIINGVQDFGVVGGMGDIVDNGKLAKALSEQGCIIVKTTPIVRKRYTKGFRHIRLTTEGMKHKCDGCRYKVEHQEMGFRPFGVCLRETNLIEAQKAYNAEVCPYKDMEKAVIE